MDRSLNLTWLWNKKFVPYVLLIHNQQVRLISFSFFFLFFFLLHNTTVTWEKFEKLAVSCGIPLPLVRKATTYLHQVCMCGLWSCFLFLFLIQAQLGSLVYFDEKDSGLSDSMSLFVFVVWVCVVWLSYLIPSSTAVVLSSKWLTNVFSDIISLKHNYVKDGILNTVRKRIESLGDCCDK